MVHVYLGIYTLHHTVDRELHTLLQCVTQAEIMEPWLTFTIVLDSKGLQVVSDCVKSP